MRAPVPLLRWLAVLAAASCAAAPARPAGTAPGKSAAAPDERRPGAPDEAFRAGPPAPEPHGPYLPPLPIMTRLGNGMGLMVVERHATHLVAAELMVRGGSASFPDEPPAAVATMAYAALGGTTTRTERDIYRAMNAGFFELKTSAGDAWVSFRLRSLAASFDSALELLSDVALHPGFPAEIVETLRQRGLAAGPRDTQDAAYIARRSLSASLYGSSHPYARALDPPAAGLANIGREDLVRVWRESVDPTETVLVVAGDIDRVALAARVEALFGGWRRDPAARARATVPPPATPTARLVVVDRPGAAQVTVMCGATAAPIGAPRHMADLVVRELLGGMPSSVIDTRLREQLAATWRGGARLFARADSGLLWWEGSVARDKVVGALSSLAVRARELRDGGPSPDELAAAKASVAGSLPRTLETVNGVVLALSEIAAYGLPLDWLQTFEARVQAVSANDVRAAVPAPEAMTAVLVGDLGSMRAPLLALGWGAIEERDAVGKLVRTIRTP